MISAWLEQNYDFFINSLFLVLSTFLWDTLYSINMSSLTKKELHLVLSKVIYIRLAIVACPDGKRSQYTSGFGKRLVSEKKICLSQDSYLTHLGESRLPYQFDHGDCDANINEFANWVFAGFLKKYMPQKHLVHINLREKLNFHDFYFQLRGVGY